MKEKFLTNREKNSMAAVTLTSGCSSFPHNLAFEKGDVSFSSYINGSDESFVLKLTESNGSLPTITPPLQDRYNYLARKKVEDGEIGVFGAEKYFNGGMDKGKPSIACTIREMNNEKPVAAAGTDGARRSMHRNEEGAGFDPIKPKIEPRTPSMVSESSFIRSVSSWESQSALLTSVPRNPYRNNTKMTSRKSLLASLRSKCSCSDKNSVETDQHIPEKYVHGGAITKQSLQIGPEVIDIAQINKRRSEFSRREAMHRKKFNDSGIGLQREKCFAFPIPSSGNQDIKLQFGEGDELIKPRKSIEIFGSPVLEKGHKCLSLERRLTMLSWEATTRVEDAGISNDTEIESDASSDLFEIESLSSRVAPFLARQESDNMSGCITPTTCYAPSEASIEWSVVTGSVADYSVMSDWDELRPPSVTSSSYYKPVVTAPAMKNTSKDVKRRNPGILSGCKNDKAVRVAGDAYMQNDNKVISDGRGRHETSSAGTFVPLGRTRFEVGATVNGYGSQSSFSRSHSEHASRLLYI